ncbi:MAG: right-handed parallel beta-helix repeat-containing protein [Phycisphaerae bacterium]|nr:right-handed parallel beta-helix repeat-containing protein [Phycisphaerae bacterium]
MTKSLLIALCVAVLTVPSAVAKYTVSMAGGGDTGDFKTVAGGLLKLAAAGDELTVRRGLYIGSLQMTGIKGAPSAPIAIHGQREPIPADEANNPDAVLKYSPVIKADKDYALYLKDCSYITIDNLVFTGGDKNGVFLENCDHITFRNCEFLDNVRTQFLAKLGDYITLDGCELAGSVIEHGCRFEASDHPIVRNCLIRNNSVCGIYMDGDLTAGGDGLIDSAVIENNVLYSNGQLKLKPGVHLPVDEKTGKEIRPTAMRYGAAAITLDGTERAMIRNNLIYRNGFGGIVLYRDDSKRTGLNNRVLHNTIYLAECGSAYGVYVALNVNEAHLFNNILVTAEGPVIWLGDNATKGLRSDGNVIFRLDNKEPVKRDKEDISLAQWQSLFRIDGKSIGGFKPPFTDPDNTDLAKCDFNLKKESSMAGKCQFNWEAQTDCLGQYRPKDKVTPGCYELTPAQAGTAVPENPHHRHRPDPSTNPGPTPTPKPTSKDPIVLPPL